jgi:hypothetical protein
MFSSIGCTASRKRRLSRQSTVASLTEDIVIHRPNEKGSSAEEFIRKADEKVDRGEQPREALPKWKVCLCGKGKEERIKDLSLRPNADDGTGVFDDL